MSAILFRFIEISLCRKGPQDLPASRFLLALTLALNVASLALTIAILDSSQMLLAAKRGLLGLASYVLFTWIVLSVTNRGARFVQTLIAILGVDAVINFAFVPLLLSLPTDAAPSEWSTLQGMAFLGLLVWTVAALGCILRHALTVPIIAGVTIALMYLFGTYMLASGFQ